MHDATTIFEANRALLEGIAYRMLGSLADAQDVVQDVYLRWQQAEHATIREPRAWLATACVRLASNVLASARVRREVYCGPWLPEPLIEREPVPESRVALDESVSLAFMVALETLAPAERAAFLLHDVFDYGFDDIAVMLGKSNAACRKLASRARVLVRAARPRPTTDLHAHREVLASFVAALRSGEVAAIEQLLAADVEARGDGGGKAEAAPLVCGRAPLGHFLAAIWQGYREAGTQVEARERWFNGAPGVLLYEDGVLTTALALDVLDGQIVRIHAQRNPDKLAWLAARELAEREPAQRRNTTPAHPMKPASPPGAGTTS